MAKVLEEIDCERRLVGGEEPEGPGLAAVFGVNGGRWPRHW